ncbi:MAG: Rieske 2Fe-2S domain-containing protein [Desulfomonilaceae bacterium]
MAKPTSTTKRFFLQSLLVFLSAAVAGMGAWGIGRFAFFKIGKDRRREIPKDVLDKLRPNVPMHVPEAGCWLVRRELGEQVMAFDDRCTHLGCRQRWNPALKLFECPCHGSEFDVEGKVKRGPATRPMLRLFLAKSDNDKLRLLEKPVAKSRTS